MADLFTPLQVAGRQLRNRIVMAPAPSGLAGSDGFCHSALVSYYERRAKADVGLIVPEPMLVCEPSIPTRHLGIWHDCFVPALRRLSAAAHAFGSRIVFLLEVLLADIATPRLVESYVQGAWRALAAGADGVFISVADGGLLAMTIAANQQASNGRQIPITERILPLLTIIEQIRRNYGRHMWVGLRMPAVELVADGLTHQDARLIARRAVAAGAQFLDVTINRYSPDVARFPGWTIPLVASIHRIASEAVVIGSGQLSDPWLADAAIQDGSVDLVMLCTALRLLPEWPQLARRMLGTVSVK
ncbi:NADH:flavin oxidoreductase [Chloroflexus sp.]|uniref:oxidoreductase n=1 Tax=Chloroflexus sp. TaxID=1904827 RepID=UPI002ADDCBBE|nr:NADH:flavin oxidoreductase [Chloroflexus sp.]